ncbi:MAG: TatA/E family twin arginine-targeting protein translocase [Chitinophagaceae bacterium]|nr:TatA/E family twin arginine-targeting protein translocase [Chitinophagaceae bacterium]
MNVFGIGLPEMAVIAAIALLVFGPKRLPELGRTLGRTLKGFQSASSEFEKEFRTAIATVEASVEATAEPTAEDLVEVTAGAEPLQAEPLHSAVLQPTRVGGDPLAEPGQEHNGPAPSPSPSAGSDAPAG